MNAMDPPPIAEVYAELADKLQLAHDRIADGFVFRFPEYEKEIRDAMRGVGAKGDVFVVKRERNSELRDLFAAAALEGLLMRGNLSSEVVASTAYRYAESMLVARGRTDLGPYSAADRYPARPPFADG